MSDQSEEAAASLLSLFTFAWVGPLVWKGYRSPLESHDLCHLSVDQRASHVEHAFETTTSVSQSITWRLWRFYRPDFLKQAFWAACMSIAIYGPTLLMEAILRYLEDPASLEASEAWLCVPLLFVSGMVASAAECQCEWIGRKLCAKTRSILISEIYGKILRRQAGASNSAKDASMNADSGSRPGSPSAPDEGAILNLMAVDSELVGEVSAHMHLLWITTPVQFALGTAMLYKILGPSGLAGAALMIFMLPLNTFLANKQGEVQGNLLAATDKRTELTNEALKNIRLIKLNAWTDYFGARILQARRAELKKLRSKFIWWSLTITIWYSTPLLIAFTTLLFYTVVAGNLLTISVAFPALTVFGILRLPIDRAAQMVSYVLQARVSLSRVESFLGEDVVHDHALASHEVDQVTFSDATFVWSGRDEQIPAETPYRDEADQNDSTATDGFCLSGISLVVPHSRLTIVYGPSGSGKSTLLLAMLGEIELVSGTAFVPSAFGNGIAYCPQEPWIMNHTLRENITFGSPFDGKRYASVLNACALSHDFQSLDHGDQSLGGDRGSRLSGGQKQRVALARALYSNANLVLLDDCLSALDPVTARHVFFEAIKGELMRNRTCIMATHSVQLTVHHCDHAVRLEGGRIIEQGKGKDLAVRELISEGRANYDVAEKSRAAQDPVHYPVDTRTTDDSKANCKQDRGAPVETTPLMADVLVDESAVEADKKLEESKFTGSIGWGVATSYLKAMGGSTFWLLALAAFAVQQLAELGTNFWIKEWSQQSRSEQDHESSAVRNSGEATYYLAIYGTLCVAFIIVSFLRDLVTFWGALKGSTRIHKRLLTSVLGARLSFFDRASQGQILNRFSKDIQVIDQSIATDSISTLHLLAGIITTLTLISVVVPLFLPGAFLISGIYYLLLMIYVNSSRDLKRIESIERSPLYQHFGETHTGYLTIRAFRRGAMFTRQLHELIDAYTRPNLMLWASKEWLTFRVGLASSCISCIAGAFSLWFLGSTRAGAAGLIMSYAVTFTENIFFFVQLYAMVQQDLSSVERITEYTSLEQEPSAHPLSHSVPPDWPSNGFVKFNDYTTSYGTGSEPVLKNLNIDARPGLRTAIVGRTGAGKSTLVMTLVRALDATEGNITIDGVDIAAIDLQKLRRAITVVPQDPTLFSGTLRDNLDPTDSHSDQEIFSVLRHVQNFPEASRASGYDDQFLGTNYAADLSQSVAMLSLGQRQLVCMARALLRGAQILVLDEATASMDHDTDARIQAGLRASAAAAKTTVITIAYRLRTIADYDYVYVLDGGTVAEGGTLRDLLHRREKVAVFRKLCAETGELDLIERIVAGL